MSSTASSSSTTAAPFRSSSPRCTALIDIYATTNYKIGQDITILAEGMVSHTMVNTECDCGGCSLDKFISRSSLNY